MEIVTHTKLDKEYGRGWGRILLGAYLKPLPRKGRERRKYEVLKPLPAPDSPGYREARRVTYTATMESLIEDAFNVVEELGQELREICDNTPENLQGTDAYARREEAADALENIERPDLPDGCDGVDTLYIPEDASSRRERAAEAAGMLRAAADALRAAGADATVAAEDAEELMEDEAGDKQAEYEETADALDNAADEIEAVEFPGMYG